MQLENILFEGKKTCLPSRKFFATYTSDRDKSSDRLCTGNTLTALGPEDSSMERLRANISSRWQSLIFSSKGGLVNPIINPCFTGLKKTRSRTGSHGRPQASVS